MITADHIPKRMKCKKHQWDYIENQHIGKDLTLANNPYYAKWICPYCEEIKLIKIRKGTKW